MSEDNCCELQGVRVLGGGAAGPLVSDGGAVTELIGVAWAQRAALVAIPVARLGAEFFELKTRIAGEMLQKFVTYNLRVAIVGDISEKVAGSSSLRDFVLECNRGSRIWFVASREELGERLKREGARS